MCISYTHDIKKSDQSTIFDQIPGMTLYHTIRINHGKRSLAGVGQFSPMNRILLKQSLVFELQGTPYQYLANMAKFSLVIIETPQNCC